MARPPGPEGTRSERARGIGSPVVPPGEHLLERREVVTVVGGEFGLEQRDSRFPEGISTFGVLPQRRAFDIGAVAAERRCQLVDAITGSAERVEILECMPNVGMPGNSGQRA